MSETDGPLIIGRYALFDALASGGMATVHLGRLLGAEGFGRTVAIKRLHSHFTSDPEFVTMFMDEARIVARIRHPNVVAMVDILESPRGLFLVMEYIHGESFSKLLRLCRSGDRPAPIALVAAVMHGVLLGLHGAHETTGADGSLLGVIHRDVSPQNIIVGVDGIARVLDFGVAKAAGRAQVTREGQIKGKLAYMAPEQIRGQGDRRADVFAAAVVLWEALAGRRLHDGARDVEIVTRVVKGNFKRPSEHRPDIPPALDAIVMRGLAIDPAERYATARDMAHDLERAVHLAPQSELGPWVQRLSPDVLKARAHQIGAMERAAAAMLPEDPHIGAVTGPHLPMSVLARAHALPRASEEGSGPTATPFGLVLPPEPRRDLAPLVAAVAFCVVLALVGLGLGGWALHRRAAPAVKPVPTIVSPSVRPPPVRTEAPATPVEDAAAPAPSAATSAAKPAGQPAPRPTVGAAPKDCDPPYTIDERGHHHYKLHCPDK